MKSRSPHQALNMRAPYPKLSFELDHSMGAGHTWNCGLQAVPIICFWPFLDVAFALGHGRLCGR